LNSENTSEDLMNIENQLKQIIYRQLGDDIDEIYEDTDLIDDLGADSIDVVEMLMLVEEQFGITIPDDELPALRSFGAILDYINGQSNDEYDY